MSVATMTSYPSAPEAMESLRALVLAAIGVQDATEWFAERSFLAILSAPRFVRAKMSAL